MHKVTLFFLMHIIKHKKSSRGLKKLGVFIYAYLFISGNFDLPGFYNNWALYL